MGDTSSGRGLAALCALLILALYVGVGVVDHEIWAPGEPTVAGVVWNMVAHGDLSMPRVNDFSFAEKPPFYYWLAWLVSAITGRLDAATIRLPAALLGLACLGLVFWIARRAWGTRVAGATVLLGSLCVMLWDDAHRAGPDIAATFFSFLCFALFARGLDSRTRRWDAAFCVALALSFYAKNVFTFLVVLPPVAVFLAARDELRRLSRIFVLSGALTFALVLPWAIALFLDGGWDELRLVFFDNTLGRFLPLQHLAPAKPSSVFDAFVAEKEPWWFYLTRLPAYPQPWLFVFVVALARLVRRRRELGELERFLLTGVVTLPIVLSLSSAKATDYLLPILFFVILLLGALLHELERGQALVGWERGFVLANALVAVALVGIFPLGILFAFGGAAKLLLLPLSLAAAWMLVSRLRRIGLGPRWITELGATSVVAATLGLAIVIPHLDAEKSYRPFYEDARPLLEGREVITTFLDIARLPLVNFYLERRVSVVAEPWDVVARLLDGAPIAVITDLRNCEGDRARFADLPGVTVRIEHGRGQLCLVRNS